MLQRCGNPRNVGFKFYGGRGIAVCEDWKTFANFLRDMGERPDGSWLERNDSDGNYEPSNCCWATPKEQAANRRPAQRARKVSICHPQRIHRARGMCASCYQIFKNGDMPGAIRDTTFEATVRDMLDDRAANVPQRKATCHPRKKYYARGMCATCYVPFRDGVVPLAIRGTPFEVEVKEMLAERERSKNS